MTEAAAVDSGMLSPWFRPRGWQRAAIDLLTVLTITLLAALSTHYTAVGASSGTTVVVWIMSLALSIPLALRRRRPIPVFGVVLAAAIVAVLLGMPVTVTMLAIAVALYPVAVAVHPRRSATALGVALVGIALATVTTATVLDPGFLVVTQDPQYADRPSSLISSWIAIAAGWTLGRSARARREYADQLAEHRAREAVAQERLRIAREMHDVVAHSMSVVVMKAAVANHVYDTRPDESREALGVIESVSRTALADIHRVLGSLRSAEEPELEPSPSLDELPKLVENARLADVDVELDRGAIPALPAAVQLSAYRIVQEALTNVIKHAAAPVRCTVRITAEPGELRLAVIDDGTPRGPVGTPGHGLIGMRERAALHHGTVVAGRQPGGGFAVHARLPYEPGPA